MEWQKTQGETARECDGESSRRRSSTPPEWQSCPGGTKPPEWPPRERRCRGKTDGGREGTDPPPHQIKQSVRDQRQGRGEDG